MIKYLGSKRTLVPAIVDAVQSAADRGTVLDLFSGTSRVGHALKARGYRVLANDHNAYAACLARCYVQADRDDVLPDAERLIARYNSLAAVPGYFTETFCVRSRFFHPDNGGRIDAIRQAIADDQLPEELESVVLVSLMEAADRVDSTTGVQMAYLKQYAPRALQPLKLRVPDVLPQAASGKGHAYAMDAADAAAMLPADVAYIDPPYNQHSYLGNYHAWESLVRWDKPVAYGVACKRQDVKTRRSPFNSRPRFAEALRRVLHGVRARVLVVSFSNEGYLALSQMRQMLEEVGDDVRVIEHDHPRYVGARIGIYNPAGRKVGRISHLRNTECLFVVTRKTHPADAKVPPANPVWPSTLATAHPNP